MDPHAKAITVYSWNLSLQRQIGTSWLLSASYLDEEDKKIERLRLQR